MHPLSAAGCSPWKLVSAEWDKAETRWNVAFGCLNFFVHSTHSVDWREKVLLSSPLLSSPPLFSSPLSGDELQFNCWTLVSVAGGCHGKIKSFSWGIRKGESGDGGPLSCSSAGCISPTLYNCVKGALPVAPSLLTGMVSPWQPDTPCPLALSLSLPVSLISGCPSAPSPPFPPLGNLLYCYFDPVPPTAHFAFSFHRICLTSSFVRAGPIVQRLLWLMSPILWN